MAGQTNPHCDGKLPRAGREIRQRLDLREIEVLAAQPAGRRGPRQVSESPWPGQGCAAAGCERFCNILAQMPSVPIRELQVVRAFRLHAVNAIDTVTLQ